MNLFCDGIPSGGTPLFSRGHLKCQSRDSFFFIRSSPLIFPNLIFFVKDIFLNSNPENEAKTKRQVGVGCVYVSMCMWDCVSVSLCLTSRLRRVNYAYPRNGFGDVGSAKLLTTDTSF